MPNEWHLLALIVISDHLKQCIWYESHSQLLINKRHYTKFWQYSWFHLVFNDRLHTSYQLMNVEHIELMSGGLLQKHFLCLSR